LTSVPLYLFFWLAAWSVIVPKLEFGGVGIGLDDALAMVLLPYFLFTLLLNPERKYAGGFWGIVALFVFFVAIYFPMGSWYSAARIGEQRYPTELWQYVKRLAFFLIGFYFVLNNVDGDRKALAIIFYALFFALLIGAVQLIGTPLGEFFAELYGRREAMVERLVDRSFAAKRIFGTAGHPNAWGGLAVFIFAVTVPFVLNSTSRGEKVNKLVAVTTALALINVIFSGSRGAIAALFIVCFVVVTWYIFTSKIRILGKTGVISTVLLLLSAGAYAFSEKILNLLFRFSVLVETVGGGRDQQVKDGLSVISGAGDWFIGTSNAVQRLLGVSHGVEVEPVYLLINYGLLGICMLACILGTLLFTAYRLIYVEAALAVPLAVGMISAIMGYLTFSLGYFFFQELVVGTTFWLFSGVFMACYQIYTAEYSR